MTVCVCVCCLRECALFTLSQRDKRQVSFLSRRPSRGGLFLQDVLLHLAVVDIQSSSFLLILVLLLDCLAKQKFVVWVCVDAKHVLVASPLTKSN